ncbi:hypothetical protein K438DRAFT_1753353 [Mycena galopus ATCC 62051]|nr:hypothetical protein K438DRAFT_1753353 [Mycena galopus ATCC 62051]
MSASEAASATSGASLRPDATRALRWWDPLGVLTQRGVIEEMRVLVRQDIAGQSRHSEGGLEPAAAVTLLAESAPPKPATVQDMVHLLQFFENRHGGPVIVIADRITSCLIESLHQLAMPLQRPTTSYSLELAPMFSFHESRELLERFHALATNLPTLRWPLSSELSSLT